MGSDLLVRDGFTGMIYVNTIGFVGFCYYCCYCGIELLLIPCREYELAIV
jgi:hypothetical protein